MKTKMTYGNAIREAILKKMREDPTVITFGEDVVSGGVFAITKGMQEEFGALRVRDTSISESGFCGAAVGAAATGLRPVTEFMFSDFLSVAMDPVFNQAAKMRYMFGGKLSLPIVFRGPSGGGSSSAAQHSQCMEGFLAHMPGLKVVAPSTPQEAYSLLVAAIEDNDPVFYLEHKMLYAYADEVDLDAETPKVGKGRIVREGTDLTILTYSKQVFDAMEAAETLAKDGISAEVIDLRWIFPLDFELITKSVCKTRQVIVFTEENRTGGFGAELSARISEELFDELDGPVVRIGALDTPIPYSPVLENYCLPCAADVVCEARKMLL